MSDTIVAYHLPDGTVVRKVPWDQKWHLMYWRVRSGDLSVKLDEDRLRHPSWDRIDERDALALIAKGTKI